MADADNSTKYAWHTQVRVKMRLDQVQHAELLEWVKRCLRDSCLVRNRERPAAGMRRRHVAVPAFRRHFLAARGLFVRCSRARQHTRHERSAGQHADYTQNTDFGEVFHLNKVYRTSVARRKLRFKVTEMWNQSGSPLRLLKSISVKLGLDSVLRYGV